MSKHIEYENMSFISCSEREYARFSDEFKKFRDYLVYYPVIEGEDEEVYVTFFQENYTKKKKNKYLRYLLQCELSLHKILVKEGMVRYANLEDLEKFRERVRLGMEKK